MGAAEEEQLSEKRALFTHGPTPNSSGGETAREVTSKITDAARRCNRRKQTPISHISGARTQNWWRRSPTCSSGTLIGRIVLFATNSFKEFPSTWASRRRTEE